MSRGRIRKSGMVCGWVWTYTHNEPGPANFGRFGGGWEWELGIQAGRGFRTVIINLGVASLRIVRPGR